MKIYPLWNGTAPGAETEIPAITHHAPKVQRSDAAIVIYSGGGYAHRAPHEGHGYAEFLAELGIHAFVVTYRVAPAHFPDELLDARRGVRFVRAHAEEFGIDKSKIAVMGSSAGGHLAALTSTYLDPIPGEGVDEIDREDFLPNMQILCYAVLSSDESIYHGGSYKNLLGDLINERERFDPELLASEKTPPAFIWHTAQDTAVNVINSYRYATALKKHNIPCEMHIFPYGGHGLGLAPQNPHIAQWAGLLTNYLRLFGFLNSEEV
jgi:acetyl esterase/lipase